MTSKHLGNFTLVILSLIASLLAAEMILRQIFPIDFGSSVEYRIPHPVFGWTLKPNTKYSNKMREATVTVEYNSKGWRDTEHQFANPDGRFRVLVLGDSFMEAYSVGLQDTFSKKMESFAEEKGLGIEVINLGVGGFGTLQQYLVYQEIGKKYEPDVVLLGFHLSNDVRNNSFPLESIISSGEMKTNSRPFLDFSNLPNWKVSRVDYEGAYQRYLEAQERRDSLLRKIKGNSALLHSVKKAWGKISRRLRSASTPTRSTKKTKEKLRNRPNGSSKSTKRLAAVGVHYCDEPKEYTQAWSVTEVILRKFANEIERSKARMVLFTVPAMKEVDIETMESERNKVVDGAALCLEEALGYERLRSILNRLKMEYVDLLPDFRRSAQIEGMEIFRRSDRHWNEAGHALAAKKVLSELIERNTFVETGIRTSGR